MKNKQTPYLYLLVMLMLISIKGYAQPRSKFDTINMINGKVWIPKTNIAKHNTFFLQNLNQKGNLKINNSWFKDKTFGYDISNNDVIINIKSHDNTKRYIVLNKTILNAFELKSDDLVYHFVRGNNLHEALSPNHFYQLTRTPNLKYVVLHTLKRKISSSGSSDYKFVHANKLFIIKGDLLIPISGKKDLLSIFPDKKQEVKDFIRSKNIKVSSKYPQAIIPVLHNFSN